MNSPSSTTDTDFKSFEDSLVKLARKKRTKSTPEAESEPCTLVAERQFLVTVFSEDSDVFWPAPTADWTTDGQIGRFWPTKNGGDPYAYAKWSDGEPNPTVAVFDKGFLDLWLSKPFDYATDTELLHHLRPLVGRLKAKIVVQPTDPDYTAQGFPETYHGLLSGIASPRVDAASGSAATLGLVFAIAWVE